MGLFEKLSYLLKKTEKSVAQLTAEITQLETKEKSSPLNSTEQHRLNELRWLLKLLCS